MILNEIGLNSGLCDRRLITISSRFSVIAYLEFCMKSSKFSVNFARYLQEIVMN